jgi:hypothetical protein
MRPEEVWPVDAEYADDYERMVRVGRETAAELDVAIVAIARNAMPLIRNTFGLVGQLRAGFRRSQVFVYENDSEDGTAEYLDGQPITAEHDTLGGIDSRGFEPERTVRLAHCRNRCHDWVREHAAGSAWTIVLDTDPQYGFSVDGVFNSIAWLGRLSTKAWPAGGMASYSLYRVNDGSGLSQGVAQYDAWAMRLNWWRDRKEEIGMGWASMMMPPVGSPPIPMNSAFGGLCVYNTEAFLAAGERPYEGGDCEHVFLHRKMAKAGYQLYLNPGCRYVAIWR